MIYHKVELSNGRYVNIDVGGDDLFTKCPGCGLEEQVDNAILNEIANDRADFCGTAYYCPECTKQLLKE